MKKLTQVLEQQKSRDDVQANVDRIVKDGNELADVACSLFMFSYDDKMVDCAKCFIPTTNKTELTDWLIENIVSRDDREAFLYEYLKIILLAGLDADLVRLDKAERAKSDYIRSVPDAVGAVLYLVGKADFANIEKQLAGDASTAWIVAESMDGFLQHGVEIDFAKLAKSIFANGKLIHYAYITDHLRLFIEGGADIDIDKLVKIMKRNRGIGYYSLANNLEDLVNADANIDVDELAKYFIEQERPLVLAENIREFVKYGAKVDLTNFAHILIEHGGMGRTIVKKDFYWYLANGAKISLSMIN